MSNTKTLSNKFISIFLLVAVVATILASSKNNNTLENFVADPEKEQERIKELEKALVGRIDERDKLRLKANLNCEDKRIVSLGTGYHPLKDIPGCVDNASLFNFAKSKCSPECCDFGKNNGFSCSTGCICKE